MPQVETALLFSMVTFFRERHYSPTLLRFYSIATKRQGLTCLRSWMAISPLL